MFGIQVEYLSERSAQFAKTKAKQEKIKYKTINSTTIEFVSKTMTCTESGIELDNNFYISLRDAFAATPRAIIKRKK